MQLFIEGLVLYKHVCLCTLMANPIAGWQRGCYFLFPAGTTNMNVMSQR